MTELTPNSIVDFPHLDEDGYFCGLCSCQVGPDGGVMLGADCVEIDPPTDDGHHFFKLSADGKSWVPEKIPETAAECVGITLDHAKQTERIHKLREVFENLTKDSDEYRLVQDPETNARSVEKIPEPTPEELAERELDQAKMERASAVSEITVEVDGMVFDGDENAQNRMNHVVTSAMALGLDLDTETCQWVLADDDVKSVTVKQLAKALYKAAQQQGELWPVPYQAAETES